MVRALDTKSGWMVVLVATSTDHGGGCCASGASLLGSEPEAGAGAGWNRRWEWSWVDMALVASLRMASVKAGSGCGGAAWAVPPPWTIRAEMRTMAISVTAGYDRVLRESGDLSFCKNTRVDVPVAIATMMRLRRSPGVLAEKDSSAPLVLQRMILHRRMERACTQACWTRDAWKCRTKAWTAGSGIRGQCEWHKPGDTEIKRRVVADRQQVASVACTGGTRQREGLTQE